MNPSLLKDVFIIGVVSVLEKVSLYQGYTTCFVYILQV